MAKKEYDKILFRLVNILTRLSSGETLVLKSLAQEFNVSIRTIQNDIRRLEYSYPIERHRGKISFAEGFTLNQTKLTTEEMIFLNLALEQFDEVEDIDKIKDRIYKKLVRQKFVNPYYIKQEDIEDIDVDSPFISLLERCITEQEIVKLEVFDKTVEVEPYKIVNFDGLWYLVAKDRNDRKIKSYDLHTIANILPLKKYHKTSAKWIENYLDGVHSAFFVDGIHYTVTLKVTKEAAQYFLRKDFLESQEIVKKNDDGSVIVSFEVSHDEDIDNIIKAWLPHIEVIEPQRYKQKLLKELKQYIQRVENV